jgi:hypothetical protein
MDTYRPAVGIATVALLLGACGEPETVAAPPGDEPAGSHDTEGASSGESGDEPAMDEAVAVASAYLEARNGYDVERARQLVADEFRTEEQPGGYTDVGSMERAFEQHQAFGFHYSEIECVPLQGTPERPSVQCIFLWSTELHRIGDHPPTSTNLRMVVADGQIVKVLEGSAPEYRSWWNPFIGFVQEDDPAFKQVIDEAVQLEPEAHRQLMERLPELLQRYEQWLDQQDA